MLDSLKEIVDYDTIFFTPHSEEDNMVNIEFSKYKNTGEKLGGSELGDNFDIIVFRLDDEEDLVIDLDRFEGILIEPREYISRMIKSDWYGMVSRKTTTSDKIVDGVFDSWTKLQYNS
jgi:hypothetical protein